MKTYSPRVKVSIQTATGGTIDDISPWIKTIRISKNLYSPSGTFSLAMLPARDRNGMSWYQRVSPQDYVELSFARFPENMPHGKPPVIMRGFVDLVNSSASLGSHGEPYRTYEINGRDYGKILELTRIRYTIMESFKQLLQEAGLWVSYGIGICHGSPKELISAIIERIVQPQVALIRWHFHSAPALGVLLGDPAGKVSSTTFQSFEGNSYHLLTSMDNAPWNELYVLDGPDQPLVVFRKTPWKDESGSLIQGDDPGYDVLGGIKTPLKIGPDDVLSFDLSRSDADVSNYFFTYPKPFILSDEQFQAVSVGVENPKLLDKTDADAGWTKYGFRDFVNETEYVEYGPGQKPTEHKENVDASIEYCKGLNESLVRAMSKNSVLESGCFVLKGNESIKPGMYVEFENGGEYYVTSVTHDLCLENNQEYFSTSIQVVRGTGYMKTRNQLKGVEMQSLRRITGRI